MNIGYPGNDLGHYEGKFAGHENGHIGCQKLCLETDECRLFQWNPANGRCQLKSRKSSPAVNKDTKGIVSGPPACGSKQ